MAFDPETAYLGEYVHTGVAKKVKLYAKDAGGQGTVYQWVYTVWDNETTNDYGGGSFAIGSVDSSLTLWKNLVDSSDPESVDSDDPTSGDSLIISRVTWIIMAVTDTRYGSWRCTVRKAKANE